MATEMWDMIAKAAVGEASSEELEQLKAWEDASWNNAFLRREAHEAWKTSKDVPIHFKPDVNAAWSRLSAQIEQEDASSTVVPVYTDMTKRNKWILITAAFVALLLGIALVIRLLMPDPDTVYDQIAEANSNTQHVVLADGTHVGLNHNSNLRYPSRLEGDIRQVKLHGEAFFDVAKGTDQPFVVYTKTTRTETLGASFHLVSYPRNGIHVLTAYTGKVRFSSLVDADKKRVVKPGQEAIIAEEGTSVSIVTQKAATMNHAAWQNGRLKFEQTPMKHIFKDLEKHFDVTFEVHDPPLLTQVWEGVYSTESLENILNDIDHHTCIDFEKKGNVIIVTGKGC